MKTRLTIVKSPKQEDALVCYEKTQKFVEQTNLARFEMLYSLFYQKACSNMKSLVVMKMMQERFGWKDAEVFGNCNLLQQVQVHLGRAVKRQNTPDLFEFATFSKLLKQLKRETGDDLIKDILTSFDNNNQLIAFKTTKAIHQVATKAA